MKNRNWGDALECEGRKKNRSRKEQADNTAKSLASVQEDTKAKLDRVEKPTSSCNYSAGMRATGLGTYLRRAWRHGSRSRAGLRRLGSRWRAVACT